MPTDGLHRLSFLGEKSFAQVTLVETKLAESQTATTKPHMTKLNGSVMLDSSLDLIPIVSIMLLLIVSLRLPAVWKFARYRMLITASSRQVPCRRCQFFANNPYLNCALHPSAVLTEQALNCSDYYPRNTRC